MSRSLVIVESPAKAKTINKILGKDFVVMASMGHVRDLPEKKMGVDPAKGFDPEYVLIRGRQKLMKEIRTEAKTCDRIILAPDPDREGEAIAWHLYELLRTDVPEEQFFRVTYNEITEPAIREAFSKPGRIDMNRVNSQQARRVLDRLVGYRVSPLLWRRVKGGISAGRVQSVALRLICEREDEVRKFTPEEYWIMGASLAKLVDPRDPFAVQLARIGKEKAAVNNSEEARKLETELKGANWQVSKITETEISRKPKPPFITSSLQQAASSIHSYSPKRTMGIAQKLYEEGLITYMRTDSLRISPTAQGQCAEFITGTYGAEYKPAKPNAYRSRSGAQEAHEAIRPTDVALTPENAKNRLTGEELKLYILIWRRFVASQMVAARIARRSVEVEAIPTNGETCTFRTGASRIIFPGYMKASGMETAGDPPAEGDDAVETGELPILNEGEKLECQAFSGDQKFTKPPARFTEASLVRVLEENGVGRPSTYAQTLSTLDQRDYVRKENRSIMPTDLGLKVNDFLISNTDYDRLSQLFAVKFTADLEETLDRIENGKEEWHEVIEKFYESLTGALTAPSADMSQSELVFKALEHVTEWAPAVKRGRRSYDDNKMVTELREKAEAGEQITKRQFEAIFRIACRYASQIPEFDVLVKKLDMEDVYQETKEKVTPPSPETMRKLDILQSVEMNPPRKIGKRTFDDGKFVGSLREQADAGLRLSDNQVYHLDKLLRKYSEKIPDWEKISEELGITKEVTEAADTSIAPLLTALEAIKEWKPATTRGRMVFDDKQFYESLSSQFKAKGNLSPRQVAALKKLTARYGPQLENFDQLVEDHQLPLKKAKE